MVTKTKLPAGISTPAGGRIHQESDPIEEVVERNLDNLEQLGIFIEDPQSFDELTALIRRNAAEKMTMRH